MSEYMHLCGSDEVMEGEPRRFELPNGSAIALFRLGDDVFAIDDKCTHGNASLSDGWQEGEVIECPFHGGSFNITSGAAVNFPCVEAVQTYELKIEEGQISVALP